ncbi:MAM and LDL-receptor class A domain-containing protein 1-like [Glandiceps talaboti]
MGKLSLLVLLACFAARYSIAQHACDCDFESGWCCWNNLGSNDRDWGREQGASGVVTHSGPPADHTTGTQDGWYIYVAQLSQLLPDSRSTVESSSIHGHKCITFWYHMYGSILGTLELQIQTGSTTRTLWKREGGQEPEWLYAQVLSLEDIDYNIRFEVTGGLLNVGAIALDDIVLVDGEECPPLDKCGFETADICDYENDRNADFDWTRIRAGTHDVGPGLDVSTGTHEGHYMFVDGNENPKGVARLMAPMHGADPDPHCVKFWYHMEGGDGGIIRVVVEEDDNPDNRIFEWETHHDQSYFWHLAAFDYTTQYDHRVVFEAEVSQTGMYDMSIDDVLFSDGRCSGYQASCNFDDDMCTWLNIRDSSKDDFDWLRYTGAAAALAELNGPQKDHTTNSRHGWYMFLESAPPASRGDKARLVSDVFMEGPDRCFQLFYHIFGPFEAPGTLRVIAEYVGGGEQMLWDISGNQGDQWLEALVDFKGDRAFRVAIEGEIDGIIVGDIAVDDTHMYEGKCADRPPEPDFVCHDGSGEVGSEFVCDWKFDCPDGSEELECGSCTFEDGECRYKDTSRGSYEWVRESGSTVTPGTGPEYDSTTGTPAGHYILVEAHTGNVFAGSTYTGPIVKEAFSSCQMAFAYHMYGDNVGKLDVWIDQNNELTRVFLARQNKGNHWNIANIPLGRIRTDWKLRFHATPLFNDAGDIAIDDIVVTNCEFPLPRPSCLPEEFRCNNEVCIKNEETCDFTDNCGDESDESPTLCGAYHRCDFEPGWCDYKNDDYHDADWWRHQGLASEISGETGPSRDHTLNTARGYYVYFDTRFPRRQGDVGKVLTTNFEAGTCQLRFYYHFWGDHVGKFSVYTRMEINGDKNMVYERETNAGDYWIYHKATLSETQRFQVVFECIVGEGLYGDCAIDDVVVTPECIPYSGNLPVVQPEPTPPPRCPHGQFDCNDGITCIPDEQRCDFREHCPNGYDEAICGTCTFEENQCGWKDASSGVYVWERYHAGDNPTIKAPSTDGTGSTDGHYMMVIGENSLFYFIAWLVTDTKGSVGRSCKMSFMYHLHGDNTGALSVQLQDPDETWRLYIMWVETDNSIDDWRRAEIFIGQHGPGWIFEIESYPLLGTVVGETNDACVDEIEFIDCHPDDTKSYALDLTCDFESGTCGWLQEANDVQVDDFDWVRMSGATPGQATGPSIDHTLGDGKGSYMVALSSGNENRRAIMTVYPQPATPTSGSCISFWYHMYGSTVGTLTLWQERLGWPSTRLWTKTGTHGNQWHLAQAWVDQSDIQFQLHFEAVIGNGWSSDIGLDDIVWSEGQCPPSPVCNFESGFCGWEQADDADMRWRRGRDGSRSSSTGPDYDHTLGTPEGWYLYIETSFPRRPGWVANILSPVYPAGTTECFSFWYHMHGRHIGSLIVGVRDVLTGGDYPVVWEKHGEQGNMWRYGQYEAWSDRDYQIFMKGVKGEDTKGDIAIDDLYPHEGPCGITGHCTFDHSVCGWTNDRDSDDFDWQRTNGKTPTGSTGPSYDHTTAREDQDMGTMRVYIMPSEDFSSRATIWELTGNQGDKWVEVRLNINQPSTEFQILIEGIVGNGMRSNMAVDDTEMYYGPCSDTGAIVFTVILLTIIIICALCGVWYYYRRKQNKSLVPDVSYTMPSMSWFKKSTPGGEGSMENPTYDSTPSATPIPPTTKDTAVLYSVSAID